MTTSLRRVSEMAFSWLGLSVEGEGRCDVGSLCLMMGLLECSGAEGRESLRCGGVEQATSSEAKRKVSIFCMSGIYVNKYAAVKAPLLIMQAP